jgi:hypothetical protein
MEKQNNAGRAARWNVASRALTYSQPATNRALHQTLNYVTNILGTLWKVMVWFRVLFEV